MPSMILRPAPALRLLVLACLLACAGRKAAPSAAGGPGPTARPPDPAGRCTLVLGGSGTVFEDEAVNQRWEAIDRTVAQSAAEQLTAEGHRAELYFSPERDPARHAQAVGAERARRGCGRLLQLARFVEGPPGQRRFGYEASVLVPVGPQPAAGPFRVRTAWSRRYAFALAPEVLDGFSFDGLGRRAARDAARSGELPAQAEDGG
ncbi:MAG: hypothetical protein QM767_08620 [Anaeromyxobacter sp.]